jgi:hypothetical protein
MLRKRRTWFLLIALIGVALAVYFEPTHCVRGWLWGEAFYDGRPTSYWRGVVERDLSTEPLHTFVTVGGKGVKVPEPTLWDRCKAWFTERREDSSMALFNREDAEPVLRQLAEDQNGSVGTFAKDVLDWDLGPGVGAFSSRHEWQLLTDKNASFKRRVPPD